MSIANNNNNTLPSIVELWANNELTYVGRGLTSLLRSELRKALANNYCKQYT